MNDVESFYPLSPMQEGMLFHSLEAGQPGVYVTQLHAVLHGELDAAAFRQAWQTALDRHPILRTSFAWEGLKRPVQVVHRRVELPLAVMDWSRRPMPDGDGDGEGGGDGGGLRLRYLLEAERRQGFDLAAAPLLRLVLIDEGGGRLRFVWTFHHLLLDAWSASLVQGEVFAAYEALRRGASPSLPARRPFRDYIAWLHRQDMAAAEAFWRELLADFETPTPLPLAPPAVAPPREELAVAHLRSLLSAAAAARLQAQARRHGLTLNTLVQGAWAVLLARTTGEARVAFGFASSGRPAGLAGAEEMVGLFVNTLVLRIAVPPQAALERWLRDLQALQATIRRYEFSPQGQVQGWSRVPNGQPLFESAIDFENYRLEPAAVSGGGAGSLEIGEVGGYEQSTIPLVLEVTPGRELALQIRYDRRRFAAHAVRRTLAHLAAILDGLALDLARRVADLPMLSAAERHQLLLAWNDTRVDAPWQGGLHDVFARWAGRQPQAPALRTRELEVAWGDLEADANRLARYLRRCGVGQGSLVGLSLPRSPRLVEALLAILKSGAAFLPLDPGYPAERLAYMIADSGVELVLADSATAARLPVTGARYLALDLAGREVAALSPARLAVAVEPLDLAYVIYTSGSTGRPKGALLRHGGLANLVAGQLDSLGAGPGKRVLQFAPLSFDAAVFDVAMALGSGATLCLADQESLLPGMELLALLRDLAVTHLTLPPSALGALPEGELPDLEVVVCAGEALPAALVERWGHGRRLFNAYGPTEATVWTTLRLCGAGPAAAGGPEAGQPDIGRPIRNLEALVLDADLELLPAGSEGELCIGGAALGGGYLDRPDLTAERFVPHPWSEVPGARLYRTGDRARCRPDGSIDYRGRGDTQVKVRGFRIELGEIEAALASHAGVGEVAVEARDAVGGGKSLVAFVAPRVPPGPGAGELRRHLELRLPPYMVPSIFQLVAKLPRSPSGKLDRRALRRLRSERPRLDTGFAAARDQVEQLLAEGWCEVLGLDQVGRHDNFFELGGDSILSMQIVSRVRSRLGVELPLRSLFESPSVAELAARVNALRGHQAAALPDLVPAPRGGEIPLSFAQQRLWFLGLLEPDSPAYNETVALRLRGPLDVAAFRSSLAEITCRHEILRTSFPAADGVPRQQISASSLAPLLLADLAALPERRREGELRRLAAGAARRRFDLARGPLLRSLLAVLGPGEHAVVLSMHHVIGDAWSMQVLVRELTALYAAFTRGRPSPLLPLPIQYADYAVWQRQWLQGDVLAAQLAFWRRRLDANPPVLELPTDRPRPEVQTFAGGERRLVLSPAQRAAVHSLLRAEGVTLFMALIAALMATLHRHARQSRVPVGTPTAGRGREETEPLIGCFVNTLVLSGDLSGDPSFGELLARVREEALEAFAHQDLPFELLVEHLAPQRSLAVTPLFQVMFNLAPQASFSLPGLEIGSLPAGAATAKFDLELQMAELPEGLAGSLEYNLDLFDGATAQRLLDHYQRLLAGAAAAPGTRISELAMLAPAERQQLLAEWNDAARDRPLDRCFPQLFAERARAHPDRPAASGGGVRLSYGELEAAANRLAGRLAGYGIGPETVVALLAPRGLELLVAVLAIWKAGGVYLPLDPEHPAPRLRAILAQSGTRLVVAGAALLPTAQAALAELAGPPGLVLLEDLLRLPGESAAPPARALPQNLAYVLYTSGSTGMPKGAMISHHGMLNHLLAKVSALGLGAGDRLAQNASQCFDISIWQLVAALLVGGATEIFGDEVCREPWRLWEEVQDRQVTVLEVVPSVLQLLVEEAERRRQPLGGPVRWLVATGEALAPELCRRWLAAAPGIPLVNAYGPTECSDDVSHCFVAAPLAAATPRVPIGRPIDNTRLHVVDAAGGLLPAGAAGELAVAGDGVGRGYLGDAPRTAAVFVPDPFSGTPGGRLYRTGDLCRHRADGSVEFLGRIDHQVKLRGFRIELGEIEAVLSRHAAVREVAVVASEDGGRLLACVAVAAGAPAEAAELRAYAREHLPEYMVPADVVLLAALPRTANGKLDRDALRSAAPAAAGRAGSVAPRDDVERQLTEVWEEVLPGRQLGVTDDFFAAGGHSLLAVRLMSRIGRRFGRGLPLAALIQEPTIAGLARLLRAGGEGPVSPLVAIRTLPGSARPPLFCVHPIGGGVLCYHELARHLPPDQPVYGLQATELTRLAPAAPADPAAPVALAEPLVPAADSIEAMAARYLAAMAEVQPHGPYLLAGWSFGGVVAFEIARQARERDAEVALVALLDTWAPAIARQFTSVDDATLLASLVRDHAAQSGMELWLDPGELRELPYDEMLDAVLARVRAAGLVPAEVDSAWIRDFLAGYRVRNRALAAYSPGVFSGRLTLLRATATHPAGRELLGTLGIDPEEPARGWDGLAADGIDIRLVAGSHESLLMPPYVSQTAAELERAVAQALAAAKQLAVPYASSAHLTASASPRDTTT